MDEIDIYLRLSPHSRVIPSTHVRTFAVSPRAGTLLNDLIDQFSIHEQAYASGRFLLSLLRPGL